METAGHGHMADRESVGSLLNRRPFLALWLGQLVSSLGDKLLHMNAIGFALATRHSAGSAMAQVLIWTAVPSLLISLIAGVVVDRLNRRHVMIASDVIRAALIMVLPMAAFAGFEMVCLVIALVASAACFFGPARTALIPQTVEPAQLVAANAWFGASGFVVALVGTALGGWVLVWACLQTSLWVNAGVFALSALLIASVRLSASRPSTERPFTPSHGLTPFQLVGTGLTAVASGKNPSGSFVLPPRPDGRGFRGTGFTFIKAACELREGFGAIRRHRAVRAFIAHYALLMGVAAAGYVGLVGFSGHHEAVGLLGASTLLTAVVVGLILGGLAATHLSRALAINRVISIGLVSMACAASGIAESDAVVHLAGWLVWFGAGAAIYASVIEAALQRIVPDGLRGRVLATRGIVSSLSVLAASAGSGWLIDHAGKAPLFHALAALCVMGTVVMVFRASRWLGYGIFRWTFRQLTFAYLRLDVRGLDVIPKQGGAIVAGNHPNVLDGLLLLIVSPRRIRFLMAEEMYYHRYLHGLFKALGCIPVYRTIPPPTTAAAGGASPRRARPSGPVAGGGTKTHNGDALRAAIAALRSGEVVGIFPEGTTSYQGSMEKVKRGVALLALKTGCPVVPLAIQGSFEAFPKGVKVPRPRRVQMRFDPPVTYSKTDLDPIPQEQVSETLEEIRLEILDTMQALERDTVRQTIPQWLKELQIAASALIVLPLAGFLTLTANPSLDPVERG